MFDFLGDAVGAIGSGVLGGVFGVIGSFLQKREERKTLEINNNHDLKMAQIDLEESKLDRAHDLDMADKKVEQVQAEGEIEKDIVDSKAFALTLKDHAKSTGIKFVDAIRGLMRPLITIYLLIATTSLFWGLSEIVGGLEGLEKVQVFSLYVMIISDLLFLTVTSVTWWFGSRKTSK